MHSPPPREPSPDTTDDSSEPHSSRTPTLHRALQVAGIVLIALNLRPALAAVGPLVAEIRADTGLSDTAFGLLTTLPLLGFGFVSMLTPLVTRRIGNERTIALALLALSAGLLIRTAPSILLLFLGTAIAGIAIALCNVLLPSLVKRDFPKHAGLMTSVYSSSIGVGATAAAGISVPLAVHLGWRGSLGAWALLAVVALLVWLPQLRRRTHPRHDVDFRRAMRDLGKSPIAWQVAVFMGLQSLTFYVFLAWLPEILQTRGMQPGPAGWMLALSQAAGILGTMFVPLRADGRPDQRRTVAMLGILELVALLGLMFSSTSFVWIWVAIIGFVLGGTFGLALLFIVVRTSDTQTSTELSGMAQSIGYLLAATGPALFGLLHELLDNWSGPMIFLFLVLVIKMASGLGAARPRVIGER